jgi:hypothetical protein
MTLSRQLRSVRHSPIVGLGSDRLAMAVLLSASVSGEIAGTPEAQAVYGMVAAIVRALFDAGIHLVFGVHPTITPQVRRLARERGAARPLISLFQQERFRGAAPPASADTTVFGQVRWVGDPSANLTAELASLRDPWSVWPGWPSLSGARPRNSWASNPASATNMSASALAIPVPPCTISIRLPPRHCRGPCRQRCRRLIHHGYKRAMVCPWGYEVSHMLLGAISHAHAGDLPLAGGCSGRKSLTDGP